MAQDAPALHSDTMQELRNRISAAIRATRRARGVSQEHVAGQIGIATESLSASERGASLPSLETYVALARVLELDTERLFRVPVRKAQVPRDRSRLEADAIAMIEAMSDDSLRELLEIGSVLGRRKK